MPDQDELRAAKADLRRAALDKRATLDPDFRLEAAMSLADRAALLDLPSGIVVSGYWPIRDELDPRPLMARLKQGGRRLVLPIMVGVGLIFRELLPDGDLIDLGFGTVGPGPDAPEFDPDVLLVPLAAFDRQGGRIGYGKGFYDTTLIRLKALKPVRAIGIAFAVQEVSNAPREAHDQLLDQIFTETELIDTAVEPAA